MQPIIFYFDPISPFGYLGSVQIERLGARFNRPVEWRPVLIGITILKVMGLKPLPDTPLKGAYLHRDALRLASYFDIPFRYHGLKGINSVNALRAFALLQEVDPSLAKTFAQRIFERLWLRGLDITTPEQVAEEALPLGVDDAALLRDIAENRAKDLLRQHVDDAIGAGAFGVPYFVVDGEPTWGVDRMWMIEHWLQHHSWTRK